MYFSDKDLYCQILGSIMVQPNVLQNLASPITLDDFDAEDRISRGIFLAVNNLTNSGAVSIDIDMIKAYIQPYEKLKYDYNKYHGDEFIEICLEKAAPDNFQAFYNKLKKNSLLRDLKNSGYNISPFDYEQAAGTEKELSIIQKYEEATEEDILSYVEKQFELLRSKHSISSVSQENIGDGIDELLQNLGEHRDQGAQLCGKMFNSIVRGARLGTMYVRSAGTGTGKTRSSAFDACEIVFPLKYDVDRNKFIFVKDMEPQKVLFIVTEQKPDELRLMVLAYISGVEERKIRSNALDYNERERVRLAAEIMKKYSSNFIVEEINDPNLTNVQNVIKKNVLLNNVQYIFYDYIFSSPSLIGQFSHSGIREDELKVMSSYNAFPLISGVFNKIEC